MSALKDNCKKKCMLEFSAIEADEILYILNVTGKKDNKVNSDNCVHCSFDVLERRR
jgi:hypothetical protein